MLTAMLTGLSIVSFADEVKIKVENASEQSNSEKISVKKTDLVSCFAGMTSCGTTYQICFSRPVERNSELELEILDNAEAAAC